MRWRSYWSIVALAAVAAAGAGPAAAQQGPSGELRAKFRSFDRVATTLDRGGEARVIVLLKPAAEQSAWRAQSDSFARFGALRTAMRTVQDRVLREALTVAPAEEEGRRVRRFETFPLLALNVDRPGLERLAARADVEAIQIDEAVQPVLDGSTVTIGAPTEWNAGVQGSGYAVAVLDTGVQLNHPFFASRIVGQACFSGGGSTSNTLCPNGRTSQTGTGAGAACSVGSSCFHGTHVAGIAVGRNPNTGAPKSGVAPGSSLVAVQVFSKSGSNVSAWFSDIIAAMDWVNTQNLQSGFGSVKVASINLSVGGGLYSANCDSSQPAMKAVVDKLRTNGIATVIAAGNDGVAGQVSAPACISTAVTVSSSDRSNARSSFSNVSDLTDLYAPGTSILASVLNSGYGYASGTSMATPHVAGAFALLRSAAPSASVAAIEAALKSTGTPLSAGGFTKPLIRVDLAAQSLGGTSPTPPEPPTPPAPPPAPPTPVMAVSPATAWSVSMTNKGVLSATSTSYKVTGSNGTVTFSVGAASGALPSWLSVSPSSGKATTSGVTVKATISSSAAKKLSAGTYTATIAFKTSNGTGNTTRTVTLTVQAKETAKNKNKGKSKDFLS